MTPRLKEKYKNEIIKKFDVKIKPEKYLRSSKNQKNSCKYGSWCRWIRSKNIKIMYTGYVSNNWTTTIITKFKKSISNFKSRKGTNAGLKVTLRNDRMFEFLDRLVNIALPRIKDFRGLSENGCDNSGNYSFGIKEHIIFPEINFDKVEKIRGMDVTIVTAAILQMIQFHFAKRI